MYNKTKARVHPGHKLRGPKEEEEEEEEEEKEKEEEEMEKTGIISTGIIQFCFEVMQIY